MALLTSELQRIKYELGYHLVGIQGEPYITYIQLFEQVVQPYLQAGASTTSTTAVQAAETPTPVSLTLTSATGFAAQDRVVIDVDGRQEVATVQNVSGSSISVMLSLAHSGTYPVSVEGGEGIIRQLLKRLDQLAITIGDDAIAGAGVKRVDEIEFFGPVNGVSRYTELTRMREYWRDELAGVLGVPNLRRRGSSGSIVLY